MPVDYRYLALFAFWLVIAVRCHQHGLTRRYWPYLAFVGTAALTLAVRLLAESAWGTGSQEFLTLRDGDRIQRGGCRLAALASLPPFPP